MNSEENKSNSSREYKKELCTIFGIMLFAVTSVGLITYSSIRAKIPALNKVFTENGQKITSTARYTFPFSTVEHSVTVAPSNGTGYVIFFDEDKNGTIDKVVFYASNPKEYQKPKNIPSLEELADIRAHPERYEQYLPYNQASQ